MLAFILRRLLIALPILIVSSFLVFVLVANAGDPLEDLRLKPGIKPEQIQSREHELGLDKPIVQRYFSWAGNFLRGDMGQNLKGQDVRPQLIRALGLTLRLVIAAALLSVMIGLTVGVISAIRQYTAFDYVTTGVSFLFFAMPVFWFAVLLKEFGAIKLNNWLERPTISPQFFVITVLVAAFLGWFFAGGLTERADTTRNRKLVYGGVAGGTMALFLLLMGAWFNARGGFSRLVSTIGSESTPLPNSLPARLLDYGGHMILPLITLAVISYATYSRFQRASMLDVLSSDYVRTARAKGLREKRVVIRHAFRTALIPVITLIALDFGAVLGGAFITENIFAWNGMGTLFRKSLLPYPDPNPAMAYLMITATMVVLFNLIADIAYAYLDPRIRLD